MRKVVRGFGKTVVSANGVRKPGNTCVTYRLNMTLAARGSLTLSQLMTIQEAFVDNVDKDQTACSVQSDHDLHLSTFSF